MKSNAQPPPATSNSTVAAQRDGGIANEVSAPTIHDTSKPKEKTHVSLLVRDNEGSTDEDVAQSPSPKTAQVTYYSPGKPSSHADMQVDSTPTKPEEKVLSKAKGDVVENEKAREDSPSSPPNDDDMDVVANNPYCMVPSDMQEVEEEPDETSPSNGVALFQGLQAASTSTSPTGGRKKKSYSNAVNKLWRATKRPPTPPTIHNPRGLPDPNEVGANFGPTTSNPTPGSFGIPTIHIPQKRGKHKDTLPPNGMYPPPPPLGYPPPPYAANKFSPEQHQTLDTGVTLFKYFIPPEERTDGEGRHVLVNGQTVWHYPPEKKVRFANEGVYCLMYYLT